MTPAEIWLAFDNNLENDRPPPGSVPLGSAAEMQAYAAETRALTTRQLFEREKAKYE